MDEDPRPNRSKAKGGCYERKVSRTLNKWIFDGQDILYRHETSGAQKSVYVGDIVPRNADLFNWKFFPFAIEVKNGYKENLPTLMNQSLIRKWIVKLLQERTNTQRIPILICQFHHQKPILLTNISLQIYANVIINQPYLDTIESFYVYDFNQIVELPFKDIIPSWFDEVVRIVDTEPKSVPVEDKIVETQNDKKIITNNKFIQKKQTNEEIGSIIDFILN